jgi:hypothetical protein
VAQQDAELLTRGMKGELDRIGELEKGITA